MQGHEVKVHACHRTAELWETGHTMQHTAHCVTLYASVKCAPAQLPLDITEPPAPVTGGVTALVSRLAGSAVQC